MELERSPCPPYHRPSRHAPPAQNRCAHHVRATPARVRLPARAAERRRRAGAFEAAKAGRLVGGLGAWGSRARRLLLEELLGEGNKDPGKPGPFFTTGRAGELYRGERRSDPCRQRPQAFLWRARRGCGKQTPPKDVPLKDPKDFTLIGKPLKRLDTPTRSTARSSTASTRCFPG